MLVPLNVKDEAAIHYVNVYLPAVAILEFLNIPDGGFLLISNAGLKLPK